MGAAAAALARDLGAEVTVADLRPPADAAGMRFLTADLADRAAIDRTLAEAGGRLDAVLNCQGISGAGAGASAETVLAVNLLGVRHLSERALELMPAGGAIVSIASTGGLGWAKRRDEIDSFLDTASFAAGRLAARAASSATGPPQARAHGDPASVGRVPRLDQPDRPVAHPLGLLLVADRVGARDNAVPRLAPTRARLDHADLGVDRVARLDRGGEAQLVDPEQRAPVMGVARKDIEALGKHEGEEARGDASLEECLRAGVVGVDERFLEDAGERHEADNVGLGHCPAHRPRDLARDEVLEVPVSHARAPRPSTASCAVARRCASRRRAPRSGPRTGARGSAPRRPS